MIRKPILAPPVVSITVIPALNVEAEVTTNRDVRPSMENNKYGGLCPKCGWPGGITDAGEYQGIILERYRCPNGHRWNDPITMKCHCCGYPMFKRSETPTGNHFICGWCGHQYTQVRSFRSWRRRLLKLQPHIRKILMEVSYPLPKKSVVLLFDKSIPLVVNHEEC